MASAAHEVFKGVNHLLVTLEVGVTCSGIWCGLWCWGIRVAVKVIMLGNRRWLSLPSTGREVVYL